MENIPSNPHESLWRRTPSGAELQELRARPDLELEVKLTAALSKYPDAPVPSNFTARVLEAVEYQERQAARSQRHRGWRILVPRLAAATALLIIAGIGIQRYEKNSHRTALAREVASVAVSRPLPNLDALENLDAIRRLGEVSHADSDLLVALQ